MKNKELETLSRLSLHDNFDVFLPIRTKIIAFVKANKGTINDDIRISMKYVANKARLHPVYLYRIMGGHLKASPLTLQKLQEFIDNYINY
jgi:hypothetical protein